LAHAAEVIQAVRTTTDELHAQIIGSRTPDAETWSELIANWELAQQPSALTSIEPLQ
jgi:hypothetical protein